MRVSVKTDVEKHNAHVFRLLREIAQLKEFNSHLQEEITNLYKTVDVLIQGKVDVEGEVDRLEAQLYQMQHNP